MKHNEIQSELDWTAFCYAAGELTPVEVEQFEARLADEQEAREALARAVELTQAVAAGESQVGSYAIAPAARQRSNWATRLAWMAVGGTAAALAAAIWSGAFPRGQMPLTGDQLLARSELAAAWSQARDEIAAAKEAGQWPMIVSAADTDEEPLAAESRGDDSALEDTPSWMTAAVFGLAGVSPADLEGALPFNNERGEN